ncbi:MAG TPA: serine hydrolase domain-containing protein [Ilumatobacter sp.]|nr:serine hydrolase domain-containing protein [Ilumatobacter sp.]
MNAVSIQALAAELDRIAIETRFSGVTRLDHGDQTLVAAYGLADRRHQIPNEVTTRFALASGAKSITALLVLSLIEDGILEFDTTARSLLRDDLPLIDDRVTIEQLLAHRSGIGDYLDEEVLGQNDYAMPVPVHQLADTEDYLSVLGGCPQSFEPGTSFVYNNGGYVVLAILAARAAGVGYHQLARARVLDPAGMSGSEFIRSDDVPADAATGYVHAEGGQTNTLHMPVRGLGDGGVYSTADDISRFWDALISGRIVSPHMVARALQPQPTTEKYSYGFGFWLRDGGTAQMEGSDVGVSFRSSHNPVTERTVTIVGNTGDGAWPLVTHAADAWF